MTSWVLLFKATSTNIQSYTIGSKWYLRTFKILFWFPSLKKLKSNPNLVVVSTDKINARLVLDREEYDQQIKSLLEDPCYKSIPSDPTPRIQRNVTNLIKTSSILSDMPKSVIYNIVKPPVLYILHKIHKNEHFLRPIVSATNSPTYKLSKYLTTVLKLFVGRTQSLMLNSQYFVSRIQQLP